MLLLAKLHFRGTKYQNYLILLVSSIWQELFTELQWISTQCNVKAKELLVFQILCISRHMTTKQIIQKTRIGNLLTQNNSLAVFSRNWTTRGEDCYHFADLIIRRLQSGSSSWTWCPRPRWGGTWRRRRGRRRRECATPGQDWDEEYMPMATVMRRRRMRRRLLTSCQE